MKVIFLDIDGVLNVHGKQRDNYGQLFHKPFEDNLRYIIEKTDAKIVISSTWRFAGLQIMKDMWQKRKLAGEVIGITADCYQLIGEGKFKHYNDVKRGHEIQDWLKDHKEVKQYVIIDDDNDFLDNQRGNFIRTVNNINHIDSCDVGYGLTKICADDAIRILNK